MAPLIVLVCLSQCQRAFAIDTAKSSPHADIRSLLNSGQANNAVAALQKILSANPQDAEAHNLLCRVHYQEQRWSDASKECQIAVQQDPNNSEFHDWLGRAYGEEAERASLLTAYGLAKKVHSEFEASVRLSPQNINGLCDLGEYSVEAPGFLGGGLNRAQTIAMALQPLDVAKYHGLQAKIAIKNRNIVAAERELKLAVAQSKSPARAWMDLASFYGKQSNFSAMEQAIQSGMSVDIAHSSALVDGASILMRYKRNLPLAEHLLRLYLASANQSEDAPAFQVHAALGNVLAQEGLESESLQEYATAQGLASGYDATKLSSRLTPLGDPVWTCRG